MQSVAAPRYTGQLHGLLSALYSIFLLFLPLMAVVLSGDLLAAYCRMRGETGRDCSLGEYLGSPEGWTELRHLAVTDLDGALRRGLEMTISVLQQEGKTVSPESAQTLAWLNGQK